MSNAKELAKYISSVFDLYPAGIPTRLLEEQEEEREIDYRIWGGVENPRVLFIGTFANVDSEFGGDDGALLAAAVTKGMKLGLGEVSVLALSSLPKEKQYMSDLVEMINSELNCDTICVLGSQVVQLLGNASSERGQFSEKGVLFSYSLNEILSSKGKKREFWSDLQAIMERLTAQ